MANFLLKCRNCRCHGNKALSEPTKTLPWNQKLRLYLLYNRSCGQFTVKISKFSLPWERGSSDKSSTDTIKLADPDACKYPGRISCTSSVIVDFVLKIANFRWDGNKGLCNSCRRMIIHRPPYGFIRPRFGLWNMPILKFLNPQKIFRGRGGQGAPFGTHMLHTQTLNKMT